MQSKPELPAVMHCWPTAWLKAAKKAGFAIYQGDERDGRWFFTSDKMRDMLATFAQEIVEHDEQNPR